MGFVKRLFLEQGVSTAHGASIALYLALISLVVRDDCVLVKWLWSNVGKQWEAAMHVARKKRASKEERKDR